MLNNNQFRSHIIKPSLLPLDLWSPEAENLLVMTMAHESLGGTYLAQVGGPALGIYQMEPATHNDIWATNLRGANDMYKVLASKIMLSCNFLKQPYSEEMVSNLKYATIMARIFYLRCPESIPSDISALGAYCKKYWNTSKGKATAAEYQTDYNRFISK
ncbi:MAG: hypothetical protein V4568_17985 [Pseudomonadota bacterium]